jgi:hypothetical protein
MNYLISEKGKWWRVTIFALLFMLVPQIVETSWSAYLKHYYQTADISTFYQAVSLEAENICHGDTTQYLKSIRFVNGTETGWAADIVRELKEVYPTGARAKIFDESANVFIEAKEGGVSERKAAVPLVDVGLYQWEITVVKLYLPYNIVRTDSPSLVSNTFAVKNCNI